MFVNVTIMSGCTLDYMKIYNTALTQLYRDGLMMVKLKGYVRILFVMAILCLCFLCVSCVAISGNSNITKSDKDSFKDCNFDSDWLFSKGDYENAHLPDFDDSSWRLLDVPHDWSIEDLPLGENKVQDGTSVRIGPFDSTKSQNKHFTGYTIGGIGWYRKHFKLNETSKRVSVLFDGVYMNSEIFINGYRLGEHPHGYTSFEFDLTDHLNPLGQDNLLAVRVRNEGKNSRWYSGSGIYRHVWLKIDEPIHIPTWGVFVKTPQVSKSKTQVAVETNVCNLSNLQTDLVICTNILNNENKVVGTSQFNLNLDANQSTTTDQSVEISSPHLWSPATPYMYTAKIEVMQGKKVCDVVEVPFGVRNIEFDAVNGFRVNGQSMLLKGGCIHYDNGPLGSAAIDRAEYRKIELLKANGFNAIRTSHNPPSSTLLNACDELGMFVIDEAFDQWNESKENNQQDYHRFFKDWYASDIASMVCRDRNHPSVIMWSIGNEIPEQFRDKEAAGKLRQQVLLHDTTRPVTQAICTDWGNVIKDWDNLSDAAFEYLDVAGYNYLPDKYQSDHARHPERVIYGSESFPKDALEYWTLAEKHSYVIGDFVWTAMDYLGEAGIGHALLSNQKNSFFMSWPWFNAWCGDLDLCGVKKPQSYYRDVVWKRSNIEMFVHTPIPDGLTEVISWWGWPDESKSWNWSGFEGVPLSVSVYTRCDTVRLELNGKVIAEKPVSLDSKLTARFDVPYQPGTLRAIGLVDGKQTVQTTLTTTGPASKIKLTSDRQKITSSSNDLAYVTVEIVDDNGAVIPNAEIEVNFTVSGAGKLMARANAIPNEPTSFHSPVCKTYRGRCLAILSSDGKKGQIILNVQAEGLKPDTLTIEVE